MRSPIRMAVLGLLVLLSACNQDAANTPADAKTNTVAASTPSAKDWTKTVVVTPEGGYRMGNPKAAVTLVEYGSLTCPHCADFTAKSAPVLIGQYVKSGKLSFEFRNFVRDPVDLTAALLSRCSTPAAYFKLNDQLFANQTTMIEQMQKTPQPELEKMGKLQPAELLPALAKVTGLDRFVAARGISETQARSCLTNKAAQDQLIAIRTQAIDKYKLSGTPTFLLNGQTVDGVFDWPSLQTKLQATLG